MTNTSTEIEEAIRTFMDGPQSITEALDRFKNAEDGIRLVSAARQTDLDSDSAWSATHSEYWFLDQNGLRLTDSEIETGSEILNILRLDAQVRRTRGVVGGDYLREVSALALAYQLEADARAMSAKAETEPF